MESERAQLGTPPAGLTLRARVPSLCGMDGKLLLKCQKMQFGQRMKQ